MPRGLTTPQITAISSNPSIAILAELHFVSYTLYAWSGLGPFNYGGNTYTGIGLLGKVSPMQESNEVLNTGITLSLSGIGDADLELPDLQANMSPANTAIVSLVLLEPGTQTIIGSTPIASYSGFMGQCTVDESATDSTINIEVLTKLAQMNRVSYWRLCDTDARYWNPAEGSFAWTVYLQDYSFRFGR